MLELDRALYDRVLPIVPSHQEAGHMALVHSVLNGSMPGMVAVDTADVPASAIVCNHSGFFFALGEARGDLFAPFIPELLERYLSDEPTALWATTPAWKAALDPLFARYDYRNEYHFLADSQGATATVALAPDFRLERVDEAQASSFEGRVDPWVVGVWGGAEAFAARAGAWAVVREADGALAAFCAACAVGGPAGEVEAEIEIGTAPDCRGLRLAEAAAWAFFGECRERRWVPAWTCDSANIPSIRLAARLGFVDFRKIAGYPLNRGMRRVGTWWV